MKKLLLLIAISAIPGFLLSHAQAQIGDFGAIGEVKFSKELSRVVEISVGQELRFNQFATSLSRSATSLESDITIIDKVLRANFEYKLLFNRENGIYETRHRTSAGLLMLYNYNQFKFRLKTRLQSTYRDVETGEFKFNPRYVWRNNLELRYDIFGSRFTPFAYAESFCRLNSINGFYLNSFRLGAGTKYRLSQFNTLNLELRFDQDIQVPNPDNIVNLNVGWSHKL